MPLQTHGDQKYQSSTLMGGGAAEFNALRIEHRRIDPGAQSCVVPECNELVYILSGQAVVRRKADGHMQEGIVERIEIGPSQLSKALRKKTSGGGGPGTR
jgi:AraC family transcriptional regulator